MPIWHAKQVSLSFVNTFANRKTFFDLRCVSFSIFWKFSRSSKVRRILLSWSLQLFVMHLCVIEMNKPWRHLRRKEITVWWHILQPSRYDEFCLISQYSWCFFFIFKRQSRNDEIVSRNNGDILRTVTQWGKWVGLLEFHVFLRNRALRRSTKWWNEEKWLNYMNIIHLLIWQWWVIYFIIYF